MEKLKMKLLCQNSNLVTLSLIKWLFLKEYMYALTCNVLNCPFHFKFPIRNILNTAAKLFCDFILGIVSFPICGVNQFSGLVSCTVIGFWKKLMLMKWNNFARKKGTYFQSKTTCTQYVFINIFLKVNTQYLISIFDYS